MSREHGLKVVISGLEFEYDSPRGPDGQRFYDMDYPWVHHGLRYEVIVWPTGEPPRKIRELVPPVAMADTVSVGMLCRDRVAPFHWTEFSVMYVPGVKPPYEERYGVILPRSEEDVRFVAELNLAVARRLDGSFGYHGDTWGWSLARVTAVAIGGEDLDALEELAAGTYAFEPDWNSG